MTESIDAMVAREVIHNSSIFLMYMHRTQAAFLPKPIPTLTKVSILARPLAKRSSSHSKAPFSNSKTIVDPPIHQLYPIVRYSELTKSEITKFIGSVDVLSLFDAGQDTPNH
jgi:hypothetical protein